MTSKLAEVVEQLEKFFALEYAATRAAYFETNDDVATEAIREANLCFDDNAGGVAVSSYASNSTADRLPTLKREGEEHFQRSLFRVAQYQDAKGDVFFAIASQNRKATSEDVPRPMMGYLLRRHAEYGMVITNTLHPNIDALMQKRLVWDLGSGHDRFDPTKQQPTETTNIAPM